MKLAERGSGCCIFDGCVDFPCLLHVRDSFPEIGVYKLWCIFGCGSEQRTEINRHVQSLQPLNLLAIRGQRAVDLTLQDSTIWTGCCQHFSLFVPVARFNGDAERDEFVGSLVGEADRQRVRMKRKTLAW